MYQNQFNGFNQEGFNPNVSVQSGTAPMYQGWPQQPQPQSQQSQQPQQQVQSQSEDVHVDAFFNMNNAGDTAVVRLLHSSVNTIERAFVHSVNVDGKKKSVKCIGEGCAICATPGTYKNNRVYIRLIDYTDNLIKVWTRTDAILSQFSEIEQNWGNLSQCVLKITRLTQDFPKYSVEIMPPTNYPVYDVSDIDKKIAYRFYLSKNADEIRAYANTGVFPPRPPKEDNQAVGQAPTQAIPKSQYYGQQAAPTFAQPTLPGFDSLANDPFPIPNAAPQQTPDFAGTANPYVIPTGSQVRAQNDPFMPNTQFNQNGGLTPIRKVN